MLEFSIIRKISYSPAYHYERTINKGYCLDNKREELAICI